MVPSSTPFYLDWTFWTVVVAALAILLSQIPPIHILLKKAKLDFDLYSKISITQKVGNPNLQLHLIISNIGGRIIKINELKVTIEKDGKSLTTFPAQNYVQDQNNKNNMLLTKFSIKPNEEWAHIVNFLNYFDRENEKEYRDIEGKMLENYRKKRSTEQKESTGLIELDPEFVKPAHDFFNKHNIWNAGEYLMMVSIVTDTNAANITKKYRFTLFESQAEQLKSATDNFKYGTGIWWEPKVIENVILQISEA